MNYLVTGGFGLIGSQLVSTIDGNITIVSRTERNKERVNKKDIKVILKPLNKLSPEDLKDIDIIYHCASTVDNYNVLTDPYIDVDTNIKGTIHLLELCKNLNKKPKIIYLSTFFIYGNEYDKTKTPINEESKTDPLAIYPATKLCTESIIKLYSRLYSFPYLIGRLTNVYGEHEDYSNKKKGALNFLVMQALEGKQLNIYHGGNFKRDYIYVDDVVSALRHLEKKNNETFLIGYGEPVKFKELIDEILKLTNNKSKVTEINPTSFHNIVGIKNFVADTSKLKATGWKPKVDYKKGLKRIVERYKAKI